MLLEKATPDFLIAGRPYPGFPILLWADMTSCTPVNLFFRHYLLRGSIGSELSWDSTARALYDYFLFLKEHGLEWNSTSVAGKKELVAAYRDGLRGAGRSEATVFQRLSYIIAFYEFCLRRGWIQNLPFEYEEGRRRLKGAQYLAHVGAKHTAQRPDVLPRPVTKLPRFLTRDEVRRLLDAAAVNPHHRMLIYFALQSGLRRAELATFPLSAVRDPGSGKSRNVQIELDPRSGSGQKTKRSKPRTIWIPREVMADLHRYAKHYRGQRADLADTEHQPLFLNANGQPFAADGRGISEVVKAIGSRARLKVHTHMLRHTYATHQLIALQRNRQKNGLEPLVFIQRQLGHSSITSTMIYMHVVNDIADDAVIQYDDEISMWGRVA